MCVVVQNESLLCTGFRYMWEIRKRGVPGWLSRLIARLLLRSLSQASAQGARFSLSFCLTPCLCWLTLSLSNKEIKSLKTKHWRTWVAQLGKHLALAEVMIPGSEDWVLGQAPCSAQMACPSPSALLMLSQIKSLKQNETKQKNQYVYWY